MSRYDTQLYDRLCGAMITSYAIHCNNNILTENFVALLIRVKVKTERKVLVINNCYEIYHYLARNSGSQ